MFRLGLTPPRPCDYLPGELSRSLVVIDEEALDPRAYEFLLAQGFRRSGTHAYRPWCDRCRQCIPARIPVAAFRPNRSQRRILGKNRDLSAEWHSATELSDEQWQLYHRYLQARHGEGDMARAGRAASNDFLFSHWAETELLELRLEGELVAVAVTDVQPRSLSALYTFFAPEQAGRSLGSFAIMEQVEAARAAGRSWLYLGYWIAPCRKMSYKANFLPLEVRRPEREIRAERWQRLTDRQARETFLAELESDSFHWSRESSVQK